MGLHGGREMNDQVTEDSTTTRRLTDSALLVVAFVAVASWLWRRLRRPASVDAAPDSQLVDDKVGGTVGLPPNNAPV